MKVQRTQELLDKVREHKRKQREHRRKASDLMADLKEYCEAHGIAFEHVIAKDRRIHGENQNANGHGPPERFHESRKSA